MAGKQPRGLAAWLIAEAWISRRPGDLSLERGSGVTRRRLAVIQREPRVMMRLVCNKK